MNIKKTLLCAISAVSLTTSSLLTVACSKSNIETGFNDEEQKYKYYELDGMKFSSKEDAISYALHEGSESKNFKLQKNQIFYKEKEYDSLEEVYSEIEKENKIEIKKINKNPNEFIINGNGEVDPLIINSLDRKTKVYKNYDGTVSSDLDDNIAYDNAVRSHFDLIQRNYIADGKKFSNKDSILNYYNSKYKSSNDFESSACYEFSQKCLQEDELINELENSVIENYEYNGSVLSGFEMYNTTKIEPTYEDKQSITKIQSRPGLFFVQQSEGSIGTLTGQSMVEYDSDLFAFASNVKNWDLVSEKTTGASDWVIGKALSSGYFFNANSMSEPLLVSNYYYLDPTGMTWDLPSNGFLGGNNQKFDLESAVLKFSGKGEELQAEKDFNFLKSLLEKYQVLGYFNSQVEQLNKLTSLQFDIKQKIGLIKLKDILRETEINKEESNRLNGIYWRMLYNFDHLKEWKDLINLVPEEIAPDFLEAIINPSDYNLSLINEKSINNTKFSETTLKYFKVVQQGLTLLEKNKKEISALLKKTPHLAHYFSAFSVLAKKVNVYLSLINYAIDLINLIPVEKTYKYQLKIPTNGDKITYEVTRSFWENYEFNPASVLTVFEIRKPESFDRYLIFNRYYNSYVSAENYLKEVILEQLRDSKPSFFTTMFDPNNKYKTKEQLIESSLDFYKKNKKISFSDKFGNIFNTQKEAFNSYIKNLNNSNFVEEYFYSDQKSNFVFYASTKKEVENYILLNLNIEHKEIDWTDLYYEDEFESLIDLNEKH